MSHIQSNAALVVQDLLRTIGKRHLEKYGTTTLFAEDFMDDGSPIRLKVSIDIESGTAVIDFTGSGYEVWGNCNAPRAITLSAVIYCLRSMVGHDVPLNQGCLNPVKIIIPSNSILDPSDNAAVVGGNVQTSQRIVDVILKAFATCAASQGCMNNITFGQSDWGYYETIAGGAGAGPTWNGRSGIHTHMTNTRITDPELLEKRYPVILQAFELRENSGGAGYHKGGDGVIRQLMFRANIHLSILTERRVFQPYGLEGGMPGAKGLNLLLKNDGRTVYLGSKTAIDVNPGDVFKVCTPGGGGWGKTS
uniref:Hydantoinase_B domain-containing protein n=2 Tax=Rhodnius prolixus TaxID=13249 RepID=T1IES8_RHOPR